MDLFTPAVDRRLGCDALLIDTGRLARPLHVERLAPLEAIAEALLDRVLLMGRSMYDVSEHTFALFLGDAGDAAFTVAATEPHHPGVLPALRAALAEFGRVRDGDDFRLSETDGVWPLLAYERGKVTFLDSARTHPWLGLAGRRGMRIVAATTTHAPDPDVYVGDLPAAAHLDRPEEIALDD